jgi:hypothetical protein
MMATFPEEYLRYRRQVPPLVPGLYVLRQRHSASSQPPRGFRLQPLAAG